MLVNILIEVQLVALRDMLFQWRVLLVAVALTIKVFWVFKLIPSKPDNCYL